MNYFWLAVNYIDLIIAVPLIWGAFNGFRRGLVIEVASLIALILGIYGALEFSYIAGSWLEDKFDWSAYFIQMLSFIITFVVIVFAVHLVARLVEKLVKATALGMVNRILGSFFGLIKFLVLVAGLVFIFESINGRYPLLSEEEKNKSYLYPFTSQIVPWIYPKIKETIEETDQSFIA
jgi:membrane protein required for colicin V production